LFSVSGETNFKVLHGPDKPVPSPGDSLDERRIVSIISQRMAKLFQGAVQAEVEIDECVGWPESLPQFFAGD